MSERDVVFQKAEESFPTSKQIREDVNNELRKLQEEIREQTTGDFSPNLISSRLQVDLPELLRAKSTLLLDTLLNYLMKDARAILEPASNDLKNKFYDDDLRSKHSNGFPYVPDQLKAVYREGTSYYSRGRWALPALGALPTVLPSLGLLPSFLTPWGPTAKAISFFFGMLGGYACHLQLIEEQEKSRDRLRQKVLSYIDEAQAEVLKCLEEDVRLGFVEDFMKFCGEQGFQF